MNLGLVGVGGAGGTIVSDIQAYEHEHGLSFTDGNVVVFDTDQTALDALKDIPEDRRVVIGDTYDPVEGTGVDGDPELAAEVARADDFEIQRTFDDFPIEELDGMVVAAGLAGGTGGGAGAVLIEMCRDLFELPVYAIAVVPSMDEGDRAALNAARSLASFVRLADNVFPFDNDHWVDAEGDFAGANAVLTERIVRVLSLGDFDGAPAEARVDRTDVIRTLATGGVSAIGMASVPIDWGWRRWVRWCPLVHLPERDATNDALRLKNLVRKAVESPLTLPCGIESTDRALIVTFGPPEVLSRKGFESARYWLEQELETVEIIAGDEPRPRSDTLTAIVVLSNVTDVPRIEALKEQGLLVIE